MPANESRSPWVKREEGESEREGVELISFLLFSLPNPQIYSLPSLWSVHPACP